MIDVILFRRSQRQDEATADTADNALFAARTLYDESTLKRDLSVGFYVDGKLVRMVEGRP